MLRDLTPTQRALAEYMASLSERAFDAGWMEGLEQALWRAVAEGPYRYGRLAITEQHIAELKRLSAACAGWVYFHETGEETFVRLDQWLNTMYEAQRS